MDDKIIFVFKHVEAFTIGKLLRAGIKSAPNMPVFLKNCFEEFLKQIPIKINEFKAENINTQGAIDLLLPKDKKELTFILTPFQALVISTGLMDWDCKAYHNGDSIVNQSVLSYRQQLETKLSPEQYQNACTDYQSKILLHQKSN